MKRDDTLRAIAALCDTLRRGADDTAESNTSERDVLGARGRAQAYLWLADHCRSLADSSGREANRALRAMLDN